MAQNYNLTQTGEQVQGLLNQVTPNTQDIVVLKEGVAARPTTEQVAQMVVTALQNYSTTSEMQQAITDAVVSALSDYSTTAEMNTAITAAITAALANYSTTAQVNTAIATAVAQALVNYYTKNETDAKVSAEAGRAQSVEGNLQQLIISVQQSLVNYYLKTETYSKTEVNSLLDAVKQFEYVIAATLPTATADTMGKIYLIPSADPKTQNVKDEYITVFEGSTYKWEQIGSTAVDLSGYSTTAEMNAAIAQALTDYYTTTQIDNALAGKQNVLTFDNTPTAGSTNPVTSGGVKGAIDTESARAAAAEQGLQDEYDSLYALYEAASFGEVVPVAYNDWPLATLEEGKVYRVANSATPTAYSDYMYDGTNTILMATFSFPGIDNVPTAGSSNLVTSGGVQNELALGAVYDVSAKNPTAGPNNNGKWESLSALLSDANLNTIIPTAVRKGGMSIKFVCSSDNKYVQYRLMSSSFNTTEANWQGVDEQPTAGSDNLVKSGDVYNLKEDTTIVDATIDQRLYSDNTIRGLNLSPFVGKRVYFEIEQVYNMTSLYLANSNFSSRNPLSTINDKLWTTVVRDVDVNFRVEVSNGNSVNGRLYYISNTSLESKLNNVNDIAIGDVIDYNLTLGTNIISSLTNPSRVYLLVYGIESGKTVSGYLNKSSMSYSDRIYFNNQNMTSDGIYYADINKADIVRLQLSYNGTNSLKFILSYSLGYLMSSIEKLKEDLSEVTDDIAELKRKTIETGSEPIFFSATEDIFTPIGQDVTSKTVKLVVSGIVSNGVTIYLSNSSGNSRVYPNGLVTKASNGTYYIVTGADTTHIRISDIGANDNPTVQLNVVYDSLATDITDMEGNISAFVGKELFTIGDSLFVRTIMQDEIVRRLKVVFDSKKNKILSDGGAFTFSPASDRAGQSRLVKLVNDYYETAQDGLILLEDVHDRISGSISDPSFMTENVYVYSTIYNDRDSAETAIQNDFITIRQSFTPKTNSVIRLLYGEQSQNVSILQMPTSTGQFYIYEKLNGTVVNTITINIENGETVASLLLKIQEWEYTYYDTAISGNNVVFTPKGSTLATLDYNANGKGVILNITQGEETTNAIAKVFVSKDIADWLDNDSWADGVSWYSAMKGQVEYVQKMLPNAKLALVCPTYYKMYPSNASGSVSFYQQFYYPDGTFNVYAFNQYYTNDPALGGKHWQDIIAATKEVANLYGIQCIDIANNVGISPINWLNFYEYDSGHPTNMETYRIWGKYISKVLTV